MNSDPEFRPLTNPERSLMKRLFEADFPGRNELLSILQSLTVKKIDDNGSLKFQSQSIERAPVAKRIPVEAEAKDKDGLTIHVLLHIVDGLPVELEIFKDDNSPLRHMPPPSAFELIVLSPVPLKETTT